MRFGIICAMPEEIKELTAKLSDKQEKKIGGKSYLFGKINNQDVVLVESGIGKVEAGITTELLVTDCGADVVINSGSAGGIGEGLHVGDIVISTETAYHDVDATAFNYRYGQLPGKEPRFKASDQWGQALEKAGEKTGLNVKRGLIVSGDQFIASQEKVQYLEKEFNAFSCEMEGASIAHVCYSNNVPFVIIRSISDNANNGAHVDFEKFTPIAVKNSTAIVKEMVANM